jgi:hypothetical protein
MTISLTHEQIGEANAVLTKAVSRIASLWNLKNRELASILGVSEASASRLISGQFAISHRSKEGEIALLLIRLFRGLDAYLGGHKENQVAWLRAPHSVFGTSPIEKIQQLEGLVFAVHYMDDIRGQAA